MNVRELVGGEVIWIEPEKTLREAAQKMKEEEIGSLAVEVHGLLEGIITERDILRACADGVDFNKALVLDWMTRYPDSFNPDMSVEYAATWMAVAGYRHIPVVEGADVIGIVSIKDVLWALTEPSAV